jgi:hypothetical protein
MRGIVIGRKLGALHLTGLALKVFTGLKATFLKVGFLIYFYPEKLTKIKTNALGYILFRILL